MKGKATIRRDGTVETELLEYSTVEASAAIRRLTQLLADGRIHEDLNASLQFILLLALHWKASQSDPSLRDALSAIARLADLSQLFGMCSRLGPTERNDYRVMMHAVLETLKGNALTATDGVRITDGSFSMRIVSVLEEHRSTYASSNDEQRKQIVERVRAEILEISNRKPPGNLVAVALAPRDRRSRDLVPTRMASYQEVLTAVGFERSSEDALKRMWTRYKAQRKL